MTSALFTAFGLGFFYFISAIPAAMLAGAPLWAAAVMAYLGYVAGGMSVAFLGTSLRSWLIKKLHLSLHPNPQKLFWRLWKKCGVLGVGLMAPVTIGPQIAALLLLALGESRKKILASLALGAFLWTGGFVIAIKLGLYVVS